jgi:hypothetical protein
MQLVEYKNIIEGISQPELSNLDKINKSIKELMIFLEALMPIVFPAKVTFVNKFLPILRIIKIGKAAWDFIIKLSEIWKS